MQYLNPLLSTATTIAETETTSRHFGAETKICDVCECESGGIPGVVFGVVMAALLQVVVALIVVIIILLLKGKENSLQRQSNIMVTIATQHYIL